MKDKNNNPISEPSLRRLPHYHQVLKRLKNNGEKYISCTQIANELNLIPIQVRKDLNITGIKGSPKKGYILTKLMTAIEKFLGWNFVNEAFIVGAGHLGQALMGYEGFSNIGFNIVAAFDSSKKKIGLSINNIKVLDIINFYSLTKRMKIEIGIITTPWETAQDTADLMVKSGIKAIWNFAPIKIIVPENIIVQEENLAASLAVLTKKLELM
ncbi:MAG: redox-sensing transcriptional repressor Rex [Candidatus Muirbacterium halophilum]|nr:redox-sensing transcriptional repressor Rex [Candidatus Muirbacterium halophilum]MCK9476478.1 redox-sensing transcriptional repressor Rex [Candidatus Muirbacterium halophilum]